MNSSVLVDDDDDDVHDDVVFSIMHGIIATLLGRFCCDDDALELFEGADDALLLSFMVGLDLL